MTKFEEFLDSECTKNREELRDGVQDMTGLYSKLKKALKDGGYYADMVSDIEVYFFQSSFEGYKRGFKDGIRFLINLSTS